LEKSQSQSVLVELILNPRLEGSFRIAQSELTYDVPIAGIANQKIRSDLITTYSTNMIEAAAFNPLVMEFAEKVNLHT
jgi:Ca-activated chloride channel family protein